MVYNYRIIYLIMHKLTPYVTFLYFPRLSIDKNGPLYMYIVFIKLLIFHPQINHQKNKSIQVITNSTLKFTCTFLFFYFQACQPGFYGSSCSFECRFPNYGFKCQEKCECVEERCHHIKGCEKMNSSISLSLSLSLSLSSIFTWVKGLYELFTFLWPEIFFLFFCLQSILLSVCWSESF